MAAGSNLDTLLARWRKDIGSVPPPGDGVCEACCGPCRVGFSDCYVCARVFTEAPSSLQRRVVPLTSTLEEGPWYGQLIAYKTTSTAPWPLLGSLVLRFTSLHRTRLQSLLGGAPTAVCVVPSTRGIRVPDQPLHRMLLAMPRASDDALPAPAPLLEHTGKPVPRQSYTPSAFRPTRGAMVRRGRIVLVEDSWTSGANAMSAAGALLDAGAGSVVVLPIARLVKATFWGEDHPYLTAMRKPYDVRRWPR